MIKSIFKISVAAACLFATLAHAQTLNLKVGVAAEPYPPFTVKSANGQWSGFEVDLINSMCKKIAAKCTIVETAWDGIIPALTSKKIDVIFNSMSITPEREKTIAFSVPYYYTHIVFVGAKKLDLQGTQPKDLKGKTIGTQTATPNADYLKKYYSKTSKIKIYNTQDEVNADLAAGRIDLQLVDETGVYDYLKTAAGSQLEKKGYAPRDEIFGPGIGAGLRKQDTDLKKKIDQAIKSINSSGEFKTIQAKYFDFDLTACAATYKYC
jgi:polar amino acid transport system substrate-binding protein